jgi:hypothetical protein
VSCVPLSFADAVLAECRQAACRFIAMMKTERRD